MSGARFGEGDRMAKRGHTIILQPAEEGDYTLTVPALPGVITEGAPLVEAVVMARDGIACHLAALRDLGRPVPEERARPQPITIRVAA
jgi:antitoxin HicB